MFKTAQRIKRINIGIATLLYFPILESHAMSESENQLLSQLEYTPETDERTIPIRQAMKPVMIIAALQDN